METNLLAWMPSEDYGWVEVNVLAIEGNQLHIKFNGTEMRVMREKCIMINPENSVVLADLIEMSELHEAIILNNLKLRYQQDEIYTCIGPMLISINPFKKLDIYNDSVLKQYSDDPSDSVDSKPSPHIYAIAHKAHRSLVELSESQSLVISGESGAGKTESTKYILKYLSFVSGGSQGPNKDDLANRIMATNPILEAFGNAKTQRNNNSSRFGKFIKISMSKEGKYLGATINNYLLEKTRVVFQAPTERNYHVFYQLLRGASPEERKAFALLDDIESYEYMTNGWVEVNNVDDAADFETLKNSFIQLGVSKGEYEGYFRLLSAILLLGNVGFTGDDDVSIQDSLILKTIASLLQIAPDNLRKILTHRSIAIGSEKCTIPLRIDQAFENRDALSKALYSRLFDHLVKRCNDCIGGNRFFEDALFIGVLDIYGFENFEKNSLEQFCINYANEKLHHQFIENMFKAEQEQYNKEGVQWKNIDFVDNQACIQLIEKQLSGILSMMDEEAKMPKGNDKTLLEKLYRKHRACPAFNYDDKNPEVFGVKHYAATVPYKIEGFMDKNKDTLQDDVGAAMCQSSFVLIRDMFASEHAQAKEESPPPSPSSSYPKRFSSTLGSPRTIMSPRMKNDTIRPSTDPRGPRNRHSSIHINSETGILSPRPNDKITVCKKFKLDLLALIEILASSSRHYIRCIKPNDKGLADNFHNIKVINQLRSNGILETIKLRKAGFSRRMPYQAFVNRYDILGIKTPESSSLQEFLSSIDSPLVARPQLRRALSQKHQLSVLPRTATSLALSANTEAENAWAVGHTQVFMRDSFVNRLEKLRAAAYEDIVTTIQKFIRMRRREDELIELRRIYLARITKIQNRVRTWNSKLIYQNLYEEARRRKELATVNLQRNIRGWNARLQFFEYRRIASAIAIQRVIRMRKEVLALESVKQQIENEKRRKVEMEAKKQEMELQKQEASKLELLKKQETEIQKQEASKLSSSSKAKPKLFLNLEELPNRPKAVQAHDHNSQETHPHHSKNGHKHWKSQEQFSYKSPEPPSPIHAHQESHSHKQREIPQNHAHAQHESHSHRHPESPLNHMQESNSNTIRRYEEELRNNKSEITRLKEEKDKLLQEEKELQHKYSLEIQNLIAEREILRLKEEQHIRDNLELDQLKQEIRNLKSAFSIKEEEANNVIKQHELSMQSTVQRLKEDKELLLKENENIKLKLTEELRLAEEHKMVLKKKKEEMKHQVELTISSLKTKMEQKKSRIELERKHREEDWLRTQEEKLALEKKIFAEKEEELKNRLSKVKAKYKKEKEKYEKDRERQELAQAELLKQQKSLEANPAQEAQPRLIASEKFYDTDEFKSACKWVGKGVFIAGVGVALWGFTTVIRTLYPANKK